MKRWVAISLLWIAAAASATGEEKSTPATKPSEEVVEAAREAREKRKKSSSRVFTNKDVKNSKGKLIILSEPSPLPASKKESPPTVRQMDQRHRDRVDAQQKTDAAAAKVADLEKQLEAIEQRYFEENDPNYRDSVIREEFHQTRRQLNEARDKLLEAVAALAAVDKPES